LFVGCGSHATSAESRSSIVTRPGSAWLLLA
jgi:hypothetical protein